VLRVRAGGPASGAGSEHHVDQSSNANDSRRSAASAPWSGIGPGTNGPASRSNQRSSGPFVPGTLSGDFLIRKPRRRGEGMHRRTAIANLVGDRPHVLVRAGQHGQAGPTDGRNHDRKAEVPSQMMVCRPDPRSVKCERQKGTGSAGTRG